MKVFTDEFIERAGNLFGALIVILLFLIPCLVIFWLDTP